MRRVSLSWPQKEFVIARRVGLCYSPIPKVATNSIKAWMLDAQGFPYQRPAKTSQERLQPRRYMDIDSEELIAACFKFVFVRNPYARLVSAYLNKLVDKFPPGIKCHAAMCDFAGVTPEQGVTFREFVKWIAIQKPEEMDHHWRPQVDFLGDETWDFIGRFEKLDEDMQVLVKKTEIPFHPFRRNRTLKSLNVSPDQMCVADARAWHLRGFKACTKGYPVGTGVYYTKELRAIVKAIYKEDFERFGYAR